MCEIITKEDAMDALLNAMCGTGYQDRAMSAIRYTEEYDPTKYGKWNKINRIATGLDYDYRCSECGNPLDTGEYISDAYCSFCGAKMEDIHESHIG